jgi:hypothetical protein
MTGVFAGQNKELWRFSLSHNHVPKFEISKINADAVQKIVHHAYESDMEIHVLPHASIPFVLVNTATTMWHYFCSKEEAEAFKKNILVDGYKPYWQFI